MDGFGAEADLVLARLAAIDWTRCDPNPERMLHQLHGVYEAVRMPFPTFRWVEDPQPVALQVMRAALGRWLDSGAVREPKNPFRHLKEAILALSPGGAFTGRWRQEALPNGLFCEDRAQDFLDGLRDVRRGALMAAIDVARIDAWNADINARMQAAAELAVHEAGALIRPGERALAVDELASFTRCIEVNLGWMILDAVQYLAEWSYQGKPPVAQAREVLKLVDLVEAGLGTLWPGPGEIIAAPRPAFP